MRKLRIAIVVNRFYPEIGGAETNLFFQANAMSKEYDVTVYTPRRLSETLKRETLNSYRVVRLGDILNFSGKFPNLKSETFTPLLFFKILFGKFDVVMAFPSLNKNSMLALLASKIRRNPFILCSFDLLDYAKILEKTGAISEDCIRNLRPKKIREKLLSMCDHIFAISNREIEFFKRYNKSVSYSPVPVNLDEYKRDSNKQEDVRAKYGIAKTDMLFFCLGRVCKLKGQDIALRAFAKVAKKFPGVQLAIVGRHDYEPEFVAKMRDFAEEQGISDRVKFTGVVRREEVIGFLSSGDVHVIPVRFMNSGAVVVETWAAGTPVIQSDAVDPNYVDEGKNGWIFESENIEELTGKMLCAISKHSELKSMGMAGRRFVEENLAYENLIEIYKRKITNLVGER